MITSDMRKKASVKIKEIDADTQEITITCPKNILSGDLIELMHGEKIHGEIGLAIWNQKNNNDILDWWNNPYKPPQKYRVTKTLKGLINNHIFKKNEIYNVYDCTFSSITLEKDDCYLCLDKRLFENAKEYFKPIE